MLKNKLRSGENGHSRFYFRERLKTISDAIKYRTSSFLRPRDNRPHSVEIRHRLSIKSKIALGILITIFLIVPIVSLAMHYLNTMWDQIDQIVRRDVRLMDLAQEIEVNMLLARKAENNLTMNKQPENDTLFVARNRNAIEKILTLVAEGMKQTEPHDTLLVRIQKLTENYQRNFNRYLVLYKPDQSADAQQKKMKQAFSEKKNSLAVQYSELINRALQIRRQQTSDSLVNEANRLIDEFSIDDIMPGDDANEPPDLKSIKATLTQSAEGVQRVAHKLGEMTRHNLQLHRQEVEVFTARAKRNILTLLILTFMVSIYLVFVFPAQVIQPISKITNIIRRAESMNFDITIPFATPDEIGELATFFNRMMRQVHEHDALKTEKIVQQQRKVETIANSVKEGVLILNHEKEVMLINRTLQEGMGWTNEFLEKPIQALDQQGELTKLIEVLWGLPGSSLEKTVRLKRTDHVVVKRVVRLTTLRKETGEIYALIAVFLPLRIDHRPRLARRNGTSAEKPNDRLEKSDS
ncbi:HAMP domain-containing protein [candidate division KSB1 bacterium]|nr:HAMP domain-containing protein [candidate division KSB1 bacterium]